ncbi:hypothetical protein HA466_0183280 [Hirschfeldia incana]|nr:hypothetical protein HA466_0183280 [Hirschfeldia incana]KAJ0244785.1 hypothetical protein HA466_0183280 [Hirschfeldia incana]KAJ0244786.1 hypothetical protein HA466_0183280 [Hirschfeldia incana]
MKRKPDVLRPVKLLICLIPSLLNWIVSCPRPNSTLSFFLRTWRISKKNGTEGETLKGEPEKKEGRGRKRN